MKIDKNRVRKEVAKYVDDDLNADQFEKLLDNIEEEILLHIEGGNINVTIEDIIQDLNDSVGF